MKFYMWFLFLENLAWNFICITWYFSIFQHLKHKKTNKPESKINRIIKYHFIKIGENWLRMMIMRNFFFHFWYNSTGNDDGKYWIEYKNNSEDEAMMYTVSSLKVRILVYRTSNIFMYPYASLHMRTQMYVSYLLIGVSSDSLKT